MITSQSRKLPAALALLMAPALWLERARGRWRLALGALYLVILVVAAALAWRASRLYGLPDIGDPFDPTPLRVLDVPEDENAFTLYRQAHARARRNEGIERRIFNAPYAWPGSDPEALAYLAENREALELWRQGCKRPEALYYRIDALRFTSKMTLYAEHRHFVRMALVEASRLRDEGDMAGAWMWYRAILRGSRLIGRHGPLIGWLVGVAEYSAAQGFVASWAADPRVDTPLLRQALDEVRVINEMTVPPSESIQVEYLSAMHELDDPEALERYLLEYEYVEPMDGLDKTAWYSHWATFRWANRFLRHEPERTRRLLKLAYANILAHCDQPPGRRPPMIGTKDAPLLLYDTSSPAGAPSPAALVERLQSSHLFRAVFPAFGSLVRAFDRDRATRAGLVIRLATELYQREHGRPPDSPEDLVGTYLERLPDGYAGADTPKIDTPKAPR
ncbi:MAG: hypothetical protein IRY99_10025 [Isosphaeraceae bacterium]|nr:hypothetical protein [Isosphaeraceae bacterium]